MTQFALSKTILGKLKAVEAEVGIGHDITTVDAHTLGMWEAKYCSDHFPEYEALHEHVANHGVLQPLIAVRNLAPFKPLRHHGNPHGQLLVVDGYKRTLICQALQKPTPVLVKNTSIDDALSLLIYQIQQQRTPDHVLGTLFYQWMALKLISPQDLTQHLGITVQRLNRLLSFSKLPIPLKKAIGCLKGMSGKTAEFLARLLEDDPSNLQRLLPIAEAIAKGATERRITTLLQGDNSSRNDKSAKYHYRARCGNKTVMECRGHTIKLHQAYSQHPNYPALVQSLEEVVKSWEQEQ